MTGLFEQNSEKDLVFSSYPLYYSHASTYFFSGPITALQFNTSNHYLVTAGDKHLQVLHNVPGYYSTIADLEQREKKATSAGMRERILEQIKEARY